MRGRVEDDDDGVRAMSGRRSFPHDQQQEEQSSDRVTDRRPRPRRPTLPSPLSRLGHTRSHPITRHIHWTGTQDSDADAAAAP